MNTKLRWFVGVTALVLGGCSGSNAQSVGPGAAPVDASHATTGDAGSHGSTPDAAGGDAGSSSPTLADGAGEGADAFSSSPAPAGDAGGLPSAPDAVGGDAGSSTPAPSQTPTAADVATASSAYQMAYGMTPQSPTILNYWAQQAANAPVSAQALAATILQAQAVYLPGTTVPIASQLPDGAGGWTAPQVHFAGVVVLPPASGTGPGTILLPTGTVVSTLTFTLPGSATDYQEHFSMSSAYTCPTTLDIASSTTGGIQEAICISAAYGWDLFVYGAGIYPSTNPSGRYQLASPLYFPTLQGRTIRFMNTDLEFSAALNDAALYFDTMEMVDVEVTGVIHAPGAAGGVRFIPSWRNALDGCGPVVEVLVDSRFEFQTINPGPNGYGIKFDFSIQEPASTTNAIGGSTFYAGNGTGNTYANSGLCGNCVFESEQEAAQSHINDTSQTLDMLHPTGVAVLPPTQGSPQATVVLPDGEILDTSSSTSQGIQEAVDFASSIGTDVAVYGWGLQNLNILCNGSYAAATYPGFGFYGGMTSSIDLPDAFTSRGNATMRVYNVTAGNANGYGFKLSSANHFELELTGQYGATATTIYLRSKTGPIQNSVFKMGSLLPGSPAVAKPSSMGTQAVIWDIESDGYPILSNFFIGREINGANVDPYTWVVHSASGQPIANNYFRSPHVHGPNVGGVWFNDSAIQSNRFDVNVTPDTPMNQVGIQAGGSDNYVFYNLYSPMTLLGASSANSLNNAGSPNGFTSCRNAPAAPCNSLAYGFPAYVSPLPGW